VGQSLNADQWSHATIKAVDGSAGVGSIARLAAAGTNTGHLYFCNTVGRRTYNVVSGSTTTLASTGSGCAVNDVIEPDVGGNEPDRHPQRHGRSDVHRFEHRIGSAGDRYWQRRDGHQQFACQLGGGSLAVGNATASIFNQPNTWVKPQTFTSPITSVSLARPNKHARFSALLAPGRSRRQP
jgi:hypothetical protein